jgi:hypothetical protein
LGSLVLPTLFHMVKSGGRLIKPPQGGGSVEYQRMTSPKTFISPPNYPNRFNPLTAINHTLPQELHVSLSVINNPGKQVSELVNGEQEAGYYRIHFDGSALASGVFFYRLQAGENVQTKKQAILN